MRLSAQGAAAPEAAPDVRRPASHDECLDEIAVWGDARLLGVPSEVPMPDPTARMSGSIEDALLAHLVAERPDPRVAGRGTYARVDTPEGSDPRGPVLRPRRVWVLSHSESLGVRPLTTAGDRHPSRWSSPTPPSTRPCPRSPACSSTTRGQWRLRNLTSRPAHRTHVRAAGFVLDLGAGPGVAIRHRMTFASVIGRSVDADDRPVVSEHRFLLLRPGGRTPAPPSPVAPAAQRRPSTQTLTKGLAASAGWTRSAPG